MYQLLRNKAQNFEWKEKAQEAFENIKQELCEAPVVFMPTEMYVSSRQRYLSIGHFWNTALETRNVIGALFSIPFNFGSKVMSDMEMK